ncbi:anti-sigma factor [Microbacterium radiodurans]|uniref:Regulator of SigK n=1 Tax=Microbacterium radiodurans TaxID=661398 RepID=A0A5J5INX9_9MICO|nr:anti-sigma factor [Microbacterium radiodurans]KAA9085333.1 anti-sigma factor [Microbacterium radiodurans]
MNEQTFAELSAGYALGALSPEDELAYHEALDAHPEWAHYVADDSSAAALLADGVAEVAPPVDIRSRLLSQISRPDATDAFFAETDAAASDLDDDDDDRAPVSALPTGSPETEQFQTVERRNWTRGLFALTASVALLVGVGWGVGSLTEGMRAPTAASVLAQIQDADDAQSRTTELAEGGEATVHWSPSVDGVVLVADGLPDIADDQSYEAWFVRGEAPIPAGAFDSTDGSAQMLLDGDMEPSDIIALTVEQEGGSPTGLPTSDPLFAIPTA